VIFVPVGELIDEYNVLVNGGLQLTGNAFGIKSGGVVEEMLATALANKINSKAEKTITILAGTGLTGGGDLSANRSISHQAKPSSGVDAGGTGDYVSSVVVDSLGHVVGTSKAQLPTYTESGQVKVTSTDAQGYLGTKFAAKAGTSGSPNTGNEYAVKTSVVDNKVSQSVVIDVIDGGSY
jgi:hypothetical protein